MHMFDAARHSAICVNVLRDMSSTAKLRPSELRSAGAVIERMRAVNFTDDKVRVVIKALFCLDHMSRHEATRQLEKAFDVWDAGHKGYLTVDEFERDLHLMHAELTPEEIAQLVSGYDLNGSGELDFEAFRAPRPCPHACPPESLPASPPRAGEIMSSLAAHHDEDEGKVKKLKRAAEDTALAVRTLGGVKAAQLRRHELRLAGSVVRALGREGYATVATVALLPVLGLPERLHPTEPQLRAAFAVFDAAGRGDAGPADAMWSKFERLLPEGTAAEEDEDEDEGGGAAAAERRSASLSTLALKDSPLTFEPFCRMCERLRGLLRHLDQGGGALKGDERISIMGGLISMVSRGVAARARARSQARPQARSQARPQARSQARP